MSIIIFILTLITPAKSNPVIGSSCENPFDLNTDYPLNGSTHRQIPVDNSNGSQFYKFTATEVGTLEMWSGFANSPGDPSFDTDLKVYWQSCDSLVADIESSPGLLGNCSFVVDVVVGDTYIFEWSNHNWGGTFNADYYFQEPVEGLFCDSAAILNLGENFHSSIFHDQYFEYTAPTDGIFTVGTCDYENAYFVYGMQIVDSCGGKTLGRTRWNCDPNDDYDWSYITYEMIKGEKVLVKTNSRNHDPYNFGASFVMDCAADPRSSGLTSLSSVEPFGELVDDDVNSTVFEYVAEQDGNLIISSCGTNHDNNTLLTVTQACGDTLANSDNDCGTASRLQLAVSEGETYWFNWDPVNIINEGTDGEFDFYFDFLENIAGQTEATAITTSLGVNYEANTQLIGYQYYKYTLVLDGTLTVDAGNPGNSGEFINIESMGTGIINYLNDNLTATYHGAAGDEVIIQVTHARYGSAEFSLSFVDGCAAETHNVTIEACGAYTFDDNEILNSGYYQATFINQVGCDSLVNLTLTIIDGVCWESGAWSNIDGPLQSDNVYLKEDYNTQIDGGFLASKLIIDTSTTLSIGTNTNVVVMDSLKNNGKVMVKSSGSLITYGEVLGIDYQIERRTSHDTSTGKYSFIGSPITKGKFDSLGNIVYAYDETTDFSTDGLAQWMTPQISNMIPGKGYASAFTGTVNFMGVPNSNDINIDITKTDYALPSNTSREGFNLIANPYPCAIDFDLFYTTNVNSGAIEGGIWLWDDHNSEVGRGSSTDYITVSMLGAVSGTPKNEKEWNGYMGSTQGFFVKAAGEYGTKSLSFTNAMKSVGYNADSSFFRTTSTTDKLSFSLSSGDDSYDETLLGFTDDASKGKDALYDAAKLDTKAGLRIYSMLDEEAYAIQGFSSLETQNTVLLGYYAPSEGIYTISWNTESYNNQSKVWLYDKEINKQIDLAEQSSYNFDSKTGKNNLRFELVFEASIVTNLNETSQSLQVYPNPSKDIFYVKVPASLGDQFKVEVFDVNGKQVAGSDGISLGSNSINLKNAFKLMPVLKRFDFVLEINAFPTGVYLLKITSDSKVMIERIMKE